MSTAYKTYIWQGPDDSMLPGVGLAMKGEPIEMPYHVAQSYKAMGLVTEKKVTASKKTEEKRK